MLKLVALLIAYPFGVAIGSYIGCVLYYKIIDIKEKRMVKRKIHKNESEGKETCQNCLGGLTSETSSIRDSWDNKAIVRCYYCGCDNAADMNGNDFKIVNILL